MTFPMPTLGGICYVMASTCCVQYVYRILYEVSTFNCSKYIEGVPKSPYWNNDPVPLTLDLLNPKSMTLTKCQGLLQCQVSSHSDHGFSFDHANTVHTHTLTSPTYTHTYTPTSSRQSDRNIGGAVYCIVGANKQYLTRKGYK